MLDGWYPTGVGATLAAMGNERLTWEKLLTCNIRTDLTLFNRLTMKFDYYIKTTRDLVTEVSLPLSSGFGVYTDNIGEVENKGFVVCVGHWITQYPSAKAEILKEFNLPKDTKFLIDSHWDLGHSWSNEQF
jgi:hypothetical protein